MFPFKSGVLSFRVNEEQNNFEDLEDNDNDLVDNLVSVNNGRGRGRGRKSVPSSPTGTSSVGNNYDIDKKNIHREIERQRRQEMSDLYTSLRSILPSQYTRGKKTISDHIGEAVTYIKDMEKNVKELGEKRDELRKWHDSMIFEGSGSGSCLARNNVVIREFVGGMEIEINVDFDNDEFSLSSALQVALEQGLDVTSCSSSRISGIMVHSLICQVSNISSIDVNRLQQRLTDLVC